MQTTIEYKTDKHTYKRVHKHKHKHKHKQTNIHAYIHIHIHTKSYPNIQEKVEDIYHINGHCSKLSRNLYLHTRQPDC